nr:SGNH superfamily lipase or esterase [uncultured proteobacterium]
MRKRLTWVLTALAALGVSLSAMAMKLPSRPRKTHAPVVLTAPAWQSGTYWANFDHNLLVDFADLAHFRAADRRVGQPAPGTDRVVFLGDSITEGWKLSKSFPGKPYINRGISGQTTSQMLLRFRQDVIDLHPKVVVILGGTNDLAGNAGPVTLRQVEGNLESMAQLGRANGIAVVLCSLLPTVHYWWHPQVPDPAHRIAVLNRWIRAYAAKHHDVYVNYYAVMKNAAGGLKHSLSPDGVHPSPAGYAVMAPLAEAGIEAALKRTHR